MSLYKIYWMVILKNGKEVIEGQLPWTEIKSDIEKLYIICNQQQIQLPSNMDEYGQAKTASADLTGKNLQIESHYCWFKKNNIKILIRVDAKTGNINIEYNS